jgi:beta-glucosidase
MRDFKAEAKALVNQMSIDEKIMQLMHHAPAIDRLNIPKYNYWNEGLHGVARAGIASVFPQAIGLASTFNPKLMYDVASVISSEARAKYNQSKVFGGTEIYQGITLWSPNINIFRDPRWGRGQETYGEDPYLTSVMGTAFVKGLQEGEDEVFQKCDATIKHFFAHSGPESKRHGFDAKVSMKDLNETYTRAFRTVIERAKPAGVMGAYNRVNGKACSGDQGYIENLLRKQFGFQGYYVSDCGAISDFHQGHHITKTATQSAAIGLSAGCDLNCGDTYVHLKDALEKGFIDEHQIHQSVERLFEARIRLGMFDKTKYDEITTDVIDSKKHQKINRKTAQESIVLLKNNGILPITKGTYPKIAVIGNNANNIHAIMGNYHGTASSVIIPYQGIKQEDTNAIVKYAEGAVPQGTPKGWLEQPIREGVALAKWADLVILVLGIDNTIEGEENDASNSPAQGDKVTLEFSSSQKQLIDAVMKLDKKVILINISGSALIIPNAPFDAIIQQFYGGQFAGKALADVIYGNVNPSGKLPITFYLKTEDLPDFDDYQMKGRTYRYFNQDVQYPFGYGLSYATFELNKLDCTKKTCTLEITNTSDIEGMEVIQLYAKYNENFETPIYELIGFQKVNVKPHTTKQVKIQYQPLMVYDPKGRAKRPRKEVQIYASVTVPSYDRNRLHERVREMKKT